jgi:L-rhamnose mutarotase
MKRYGALVGLRPEHYEEYKRQHAAVWPDVLATIEQCNIRNYTIYHHDGLLFSTYEYWGTDHAADMAKMAADPATQHWWALMEPMQKRIEGTPTGEWWMPMEELFHFEGPREQEPALPST